MLLLTLHQTLKALVLGVQGLVVVTSELEEIIEALLDFKVRETKRNNLRLTSQSRFLSLGLNVIPA